MPLLESLLKFAAQRLGTASAAAAAAATAATAATDTADTAAAAATFAFYFRATALLVQQRSIS